LQVHLAVFLWLGLWKQYQCVNKYIHLEAVCLSCIWHTQFNHSIIGTYQRNSLILPLCIWLTVCVCATSHTQMHIADHSILYVHYPTVIYVSCWAKTSHFHTILKSLFSLFSTVTKECTGQSFMQPFMMNSLWRYSTRQLKQ